MYYWNDLKPWKKFVINWDPFEVLSYAQKVMGRWGSIINIKAKNLLSGATITKTFSDSDKFEPADIVTRSYDYLYSDWENYFFMNIWNYEQISLWKDIIWEDILFLTDWDRVLLQEFNGKAINLNLESSVVLEVTETPPWEKWDTATWWKKPATMSTWLIVQVPLFINIWDKIKIDTKTKQYQSRV